MAPLPPTAVALCVMLLLAASCAAVARATAPARVHVATRPPAVVAAERVVVARRAAAAAAVGVVVLLATSWLVLAALAAAMVATWGRLLHDDRAAEERERVEGIAKWLEDLRDTLRGSAVGAEEALEQVALRPPAALSDAMQAFVRKRRLGFRTEDALGDLSDELAHPTSDAAIAAISLVIGGSAGAGRLHTTVQTLAASARDEVTARERIDRTRAVYQGSMKRLITIGALLVLYLRFAGGDLLDPYNSAVGQAVLMLPIAMWGGCILWLRSLCRYDVPVRHRPIVEASK